MQKYVFKVHVFSLCSHHLIDDLIRGVFHSGPLNIFLWLLIHLRHLILGDCLEGDLDTFIYLLTKMLFV